MQGIQKTTVAGSAGRPPGCAFCMIYKSGLCNAAEPEGASSNTSIEGRKIEISVHTVHARQMILHPREPSEFVTFICSGQAISSIGLPDGRRQIFEILLPGDIVFWTVLFEPMSGRLTEAIDDSIYRKIKRVEFMALLTKQPDFFKMFMRISAYKKNQCDQLALTLGRRNASQRIARLILDLAKRFAERGLMSDYTFRFSLRQRHIADATGLTPVHTSKILRQLRRAKIIDFEHRSLKIFDMTKLLQVAGP